MEKGPKVRVVGGRTEAEKEKIQKRVNDIFYNNSEFLDQEDIELMKKYEQEKTKEEITLINFANKETSRLMKEAGLEPFDIPLDNLYVVSAEPFFEMPVNHRIAFSDPGRYCAVFNHDFFEKDPSNFGSSALHEMLHLKSHISMQSNSGSQTLFRVGFSILSSQKEAKEGRGHEHFSGLNEAVVSEAERRLNAKLLELPELKKEKEWLDSRDCREIKAGIARERNILESDIAWCDKEGKEFRTFSYLYQRKVFCYLCEEIQKQFSDEFKDKDDVYKVFLDALFTGRLLEIAHLVEDTFGKGSFRILGNMDGSKDSAVLHLETFKNLRYEKLNAGLEKRGSSLYSADYNK